MSLQNAERNRKLTHFLFSQLKVAKLDYTFNGTDSFAAIKIDEIHLLSI